MATDKFSIHDLCTRVQKLVPRSIGSEAWYLIIVRIMISLRLAHSVLGLDLFVLA
jgi:hypothetical protein